MKMSRFLRHLCRREVFASSLLASSLLASSLLASSLLASSLIVKLLDCQVACWPGLDIAGSLYGLGSPFGELSQHY